MRHVLCPVCGGVQGVVTDAAMQAQCAFCRSFFVVPQASPPPPLAQAPQPAVTPEPVAVPHPAADSGPTIVPRGMLLEFTFFGLFVALFIAGLIVVVLVARHWKPGVSAQRQRVEEIVIVPKEEPHREPRWSNASRISLQLDGVKTRIDHVEYAEVLARDERRRVVTTKNSYLTIWVHLENKRAEPAEYRSWYGNQFQQAGRKAAAKLVDSRGVEYPQKQFTDVREIKGHIEGARLAMQDATRDTIVFEVPEDVQRSEVSGFRLELPGAAFGGDGFLRFEINLGLVEGW
jgi:hypothetical protein